MRTALLALAIFVFIGCSAKEGASCNPGESYTSRGFRCTGAGVLYEMSSRGNMCDRSEANIPYMKNGEMLVCHTYDGYGTVAVRAYGDSEMDTKIAKYLAAKKARQEQEEQEKLKAQAEVKQCVTGLNIVLGSSSRLMAYGLNRPKTDIKAIYYNELSQNGSLMGISYEAYEKTVTEIVRKIIKECKGDKKCIGSAGYNSYKETEKYHTYNGFDYDSYCSDTSN